MENVQDNSIQDLGQSFQASPAVLTNCTVYDEWVHYMWPRDEAYFS